MMSLETRLHLVAGDDTYLGPFSQTQVPQDRLDSYLEPVWTDDQAFTTIERCETNGKVEPIAEGFECCQTLTATYEGQPITWVERRLVIRSLAHAKRV